MPMIDRRVALLVSAILLAGCASPGPAPVESRTRPPAAVVRPAAPAPAVPPAAAGARPARPAAGTPEVAVAEVQAAPVRSSGLQVRPLETTPLPPAGPPPRTGPVGVRQPYSDSALAAMRDPVRAGTTAQPAAPGASAPGSAPAAAAAPAPSPTGASAPAQPPAAAPAPRADAPAAAPSAPSAVSAAGFAWPARGRVIQGFSAPQRMGILIDGRAGDPVTAAADGRVIFSGPGPRGYGNLVIVRHEGETLSVYAHNRSLAVKEGDAVRRGQKIAEIGATGTDSPKLHFEIRQAGRPVDPMRLLPPR